MKGAPIDKALCENLKKYRRGQEKADGGMTEDTENEEK